MEMRCTAVQIFLGELTQEVIKDFQNRKTCSVNFLQWGGGMCGPILYISDYGR